MNFIELTTNEGKFIGNLNLLKRVFVTKEGNPKKTFLNFRNSLLMLLKNLPKKDLFPIIFSRLLLDGLAGVQFIVKGKFKHCLAIVRAHFAFYSLIFKNLSKRETHQKANYFQKKSVVYFYFVKNGKVFDK